MLLILYNDKLGLPGFQSQYTGEFFISRHARQFVTLIHAKPVFSVRSVWL